MRIEWVGFAVVFVLLITPACATDWWDYSWSYRMPVEIQSSDSLTDYQVKLIVDTQSLINAGKMESDCADIRFLDSSNNLLSYWIEDGCNSGQTVIWVKVPQITSSTTIYMYYGNPSASSASNGEGTFLFFDDFNSLDGWGMYQSCQTVGYCEVVTYEGKSCLKMKGLGEVVYSLTGMPVTGYGVIMLSKLTTPSYMEAYMPFFGFGSSSRTGDEDNAYQFGYNVYKNGPGYSQDNIRIFVDGTRVAEKQGTDTAYRQRTGWARVDTTVFNGKITQKVYDSSKGEQTLEIADTGQWTNTAPEEVGIIVWDVAGPTSLTTYVTDWILIRKYVNPEPSVGFGGEEYNQTEIPEFPSILIPLMIAAAVTVLLNRRK